MSRVFFLFFFQAEDGIRDVAVTGVQTCALPISPPRELDSTRTQAMFRCAPERKPGKAGDALGDLLTADEAADGIARLGALGQPMLDALRVQLDLRGLFQGIVGSYVFHLAAIAGATLFDDDNAIKRLLLLPNPLQTDHQHKPIPPERYYTGRSGIRKCPAVGRRMRL